MSALPEQVRRQAEEADRIEKEIAAAMNPTDVPVEEPAEPETPVEQPPEQVEQPAEPEQREEPTKSEDETWRAKYFTLQGMYNADVPRLNARVKELETQLQTALSRQPEPAKDTPKPASSAPLVTKQDEQAFGADLLDVIKRQAQEIVQAQHGELLEKVGRLEAENSKLHERLGTVTETQEQHDHKTFLSECARRINDFVKVNRDPAFIQFLDTVDPRSGLPLKAFLQDAVAQRDVERAVAIFESWPGYVKNAPAPKSNPKADLAKQVVPSTTRSSSPPTDNPNSKIWHQAEIDKFYRDVSQGAYRGDPKRAAQIEAEIDLAVSQGRVQD